MPASTAALRRFVQTFDFQPLFLEELGWDRHRAHHEFTVDTDRFALEGIAEKRGFQVFRCAPGADGSIPNRAARMRIERELAKVAFEHLIVFADAEQTSQTWHWARRESGKPVLTREETYTVGQSGERLAQKLAQLAVSFPEEDGLTLPGVAGKVKAGFDVDRVTKRFYDRFKTEHARFLSFVAGIQSKGDRDWYASLMLNRLMFIYFIQKKGFLDEDLNYLRNRLRLMRQRNGADRFFSFYQHFLLRLFHEGLGGQVRNAELDALLGNVPYLNGGLFDVHELERENPDIQIPDEAFERIFDFFDGYHWHLDERPLRADNEINPDVLGYIFEKYINQKQMGAYYTKEDITGYIARNTVLPFLFDAARKDCVVAFRPDGSVWRLLREDPKRYIYDEVKRGIDLPLPVEIAAGVDDVRQRSGWNRPADPDFALPTETWREHVARRTRCLDLRNKLARGEVVATDDLITYNLDIEQFAADVIDNCEGPELLRAFYHSLEDVTILDPTCGSGAFLFAALNLLEPLYEACLERMEAFVDELDRSSEKHHPEKFSDFRRILQQVTQHPNRKHFILKSIILGNLYGVDFMEEAVEICKLRLFLKLVAQVDNADQIEPLPDIDFNIRAGNTLVGFATLAQVREALTASASGQIRMLSTKEEETLRRIEERADDVDRIFQLFRKIQTEHGLDAADFARGKRELRGRLRYLTQDLDRYLASHYGIKTADPVAFEHWRQSHQPFHWFAEFYRIIKDGGFDVVIGNPPYFELKELQDYKPRGYSCADTGNIYALVMERCCGLRPAEGRLGFIVPVSSISTDDYASLQRIILKHAFHVSCYDDRPSRLFTGVEHARLTTHLLGHRAQDRSWTTRYIKWSSTERPSLFHNLRYAARPSSLIDGTIPKVSSEVEASIIGKLSASHRVLASFYYPRGNHRIYYSRKVGYFLQVLDFEPRVLDGAGRLRPPSEFKELRFASAAEAGTALACLNSSLFYWFVTVFSDCRHVNKREVDSFPIDLHSLAPTHQARLLQLGGELMTELQRTSVDRRMSFRHDELVVQCIFPRYSKPTIDAIDHVLGEHYGFTGPELDLVLHYDIKYRLGVEDGERAISTMGA